MTLLVGSSHISRTENKGRLAEMIEYFLSNAGLLFLDHVAPVFHVILWDARYLAPTVTFSIVQPNPAPDNPLNNKDSAVKIVVTDPLVIHVLISFFNKE